MAVSEAYPLSIVIGKLSMHKSISLPKIGTTDPLSSISTKASTVKGESSTLIVISSSTTVIFPVHVVYVTFAV